MNRTISSLVGSSQYHAVADDSLKDEDNAAWVMQLEPDVRNEWIERIGWIRLVDRLAENELIDFHGSRFQKFRASWKFLLTKGIEKPGCDYQDVLTKIRDRWFNRSPDRNDHLSIQAWDAYVEATATYHKAELVVDSLEQYEEMMESTTGSFFQTFPFLADKYRQSARYFGIVDQFYNNLRDLREDAEQGICYFPTQTLNQFGVSREEILQMQCFANPGYHRMMEFWLDDYLPKLRRKTYDLVLAQDLHPSWQILRDWSVRRYSCIERVFRHCNFNYALFPQHYWAEVKQDLSWRQLLQLSCGLDNLGQTHEVAKASKFLALSPATIRTVRALGDRLRITHQARQNDTFATYAVSAS